MFHFSFSWLINRWIRTTCTIYSNYTFSTLGTRGVQVASILRAILRKLNKTTQLTAEILQGCQPGLVMVQGFFKPDFLSHIAKENQAIAVYRPTADEEGGILTKSVFKSPKTITTIFNHVTYLFYNLFFQTFK